MDKSAIDSWAERSRAIDLDGIPWEDVRRIPLGADAVRTLRYMQDKSNTVIYVRPLLATRAIDAPDVSAFLACWFYEETFHGRALARVLVAAGESPVERKRSRRTLTGWIEERAMGAVARVWPDFVAVHMVWGAINELTTLAGYQRLDWPHPVLGGPPRRIIRDERHFSPTTTGRAPARSLPRAAARPSSIAWHPWGAGCAIRRCASRRFPLRGHGRAGRRAQDRRDHPAAARPRGRRTGRIVARTGDSRADDGRGPDGTGREDGASVARSVTACEAQPIPSAPSSTNRRRAQGCTQASRATAPAARAGSNPRSAPRTLDGRPKVSATRSA